MTTMLDLSKKKPALPVKLPDETLIRVYAPTKGMMEEFLTIAEELNHMGNDKDAMARIYEITAHVMSNNAGGRELSADELASMLDVGDIIIFVKAYTAFLGELTSEKN